MGGSNKPDEDGALISDTPMAWMIKEAKDLTVEAHIKQGLNESSTASLHNSRRSFYRVRGKHFRKIDEVGVAVFIKAK